MSDTLIYQTSDPVFADRILAALRSEGIDCYRVGEGLSRLNAAGHRLIADQVSIFILKESDYVVANSILLRLGSEIEEPRNLPARWSLMAVTAIIVAIALAVSLN